MQIFNKRKKKNGTNEGNPFLLKFNIRENLIVFLLFISASIAIFFSAAIIYTLLDGSFEFFTNVNIIEFLTGTEWVPHGREPLFGILPLLSGTFLIAGGALIIGAPLGIAAAIFLSEFAGERLRSFVKPIIEILAGIPSIVYAFFALLFISPIFRDNFGADYFNAASAIVVIAIMVMPIVISISDDAMKAVPNYYRETSLALGATKWETATKIVMPAASSGIIASILLGFARALGETMVVLLVSGGIANLGLNPFEQTLTMSGYIGRVAAGDIPPGLAISAAFAVGIVLFLITYGINTVAAKIVIRIKKKTSIKSKDIKKKKKILSKYFSKISNYLSKIGSKIYLKLSKIKNKIRKPKPLSLKKRYIKQKIGISLVGASIVIASVFLAILLGHAISEGVGGLSVTFLTSYPSWMPEKAGIFPVIMGSVYLMVLTIIFAAPMGIGAAIYLNEFAKDTRYTRFLRRIIQNLAGVPSIVFGLLGYVFFAHFLGFGLSLLSGSLVLTIMILPIIVVATEESLKAVPDSFRKAARGLGSTRWQTVRHHVLPNAIPGISTGIILSLSRAIGETAPLLFIVSFFAKTPPSGIFDGFMALPSQIFYWATHPKHEFQMLAASTILVLLMILLTMNAIAIIIRQRAQARRDW
jgi:phosphate ABC transporter permease subunit PstA/phosphate ABC transporter permease protein PstC